MVKDEGARKSAADKLGKSLAPLDEFFSKSGTNFISGSSAGMNDYMFWPFLERIALYFLDKVKAYPHIHAYYHRMGEDAAVIACRHPAALHREFIDDFRIGKMEYDIGPIWPSLD